MPDLVGRDERLTEFGANLRLPPGELDRKFLFNIHGVAGVGKTFLTEQFRRVAERAGVVCAYADEASFDVLETLTALAADLAGQDRALAAFDKRLATYRERRYESETDPGAPGGGFITRSAVRVGLAATRGTPARHGRRHRRPHRGRRAGRPVACLPEQEVPQLGGRPAAAPLPRY